MGYINVIAQTGYGFTVFASARAKRDTFEILDDMIRSWIDHGHEPTVKQIHDTCKNFVENNPNPKRKYDKAHCDYFKNVLIPMLAAQNQEYRVEASEIGFKPSVLPCEIEVAPYFDPNAVKLQADSIGPQ